MPSVFECLFLFLGLEECFTYTFGSYLSSFFSPVNSEVWCVDHIQSSCTLWFCKFFSPLVSEGSISSALCSILNTLSSAWLIVLIMRLTMFTWFHFLILTLYIARSGVGKLGQQACPCVPVEVSKLFASHSFHCECQGLNTADFFWWQVSSSAEPSPSPSMNFLFLILLFIFEILVFLLIFLLWCQFFSTLLLIFALFMLTFSYRLQTFLSRFEYICLFVRLFEIIIWFYLL